MTPDGTNMPVQAALSYDWAVAILADGQHGMVARRQLLALGLSRHAIGHRLAAGRLHPYHNGVYAVGHRKLTVRSRWMAATLATEGALSHRDAGALRGIRPDHRSRVDVTVVSRRTRRGLDVHVAVLPADEIETVDGIPVTSLHRTLLDLAAIVPERQVERAMEEAARRRLADPVPLAELLSRHPLHIGARVIRRILDRGRPGRTWTRSGLEEAFLAYVDRHGLTRPECNAHVAVDGQLLECDAVYRLAGVVVELDSREYHDDDRSFAEDRRKSRRLSVARWHPIRVAPEHLEDAELAAHLRRLLG